MDNPCDEALRELYEYLHGELDDTRRDQIRHHLDACAPCVGAYDFEAELRIVISQRCRERVSDELRQRIARAIGYVDERSGGSIGA